MFSGERGVQINLGIRAYTYLAVIFAVFLAIIIRLWYLQVLMGVFFKDRSENNRLQTIFLAPERGRILDRNGVELAGNRASFNIELISTESQISNQTVTKLSQILNIERSLIEKRFKINNKRRKFEPKLLAKDVSRDTVARVMSSRFLLPGLSIAVVPVRAYKFKDEAAHLLGYVSEISPELLENENYVTYRQGDIVGKAGVELKLEQYLQGQRGRQRVVVNAMGTRLGELSKEEHLPGHTVNLTIDSRVQIAADEALNFRRGAIVALDAQTGEILALSSSPRFDPNIFVGEVLNETWKDLNRDKKLMNRAIQGSFPPGSVFKIFMSVAGLSEGVIKPNDGVFCGGALHFAGRDYKCHKKTGHGTVNLYSALVQSCDVYYYTLGQRLGVDRIHDYASRFGLGTKTGIDLLNEVPGLVPSSAWKKKRFNERWYPGETLSVAIGQGAVTTTPLQIAAGTAALVNGGNLFKPKIIRSVISEDGRVLLPETQPNIKSTVNVDPKILQSVVKDMEGVVNDPRGTGHRSVLNKLLGDIKVGGKTGTAQVVGLHHGTKGMLNDHAWFVGFAPTNDPQIVVSAIVENGGHGGVAAAPLVRHVLERYFDPEAKIVKLSDLPVVEIGGGVGD